MTTIRMAVQAAQRQLRQADKMKVQATTPAARLTADLEVLGALSFLAFVERQQEAGTRKRKS